MTKTKAAISCEAADNAREDVEAFNKDLIAHEKGAESPSSTILGLRADDSLTRLQRALRDFSEAYQHHYEDAVIHYTQPVLFLRRPTSHPVSMDALSGCLALGKIGGGQAEELETGRAFVWERGQNHVFGDVDAIYVGFKVVEKSR